MIIEFFSLLYFLVLICSSLCFLFVEVFSEFFLSFSQIWWSFLILLILTLYLVNVLSSFCLILFLKLYPVLSIERYSFFCPLILPLCACFYVLDISTRSLALESDIVWNVSSGSQWHILSWSPESLPVWATCALLWWLDCDFCRHAGE